MLKPYTRLAFPTHGGASSASTTISACEANSRPSYVNCIRRDIGEDYLICSGEQRCRHGRPPDPDSLPLVVSWRVDDQDGCEDICPMVKDQLRRSPIPSHRAHFESEGERQLENVNRTEMLHPGYQGGEREAGETQLAEQAQSLTEDQRVRAEDEEREASRGAPQPHARNNHTC